MPLGKAYDKLIDSKNGRHEEHRRALHGDAITAAQFLQRFIKDTPWAHLDVAGTAMDSSRTDINPSWASGWGVRAARPPRRRQLREDGALSEVCRRVPRARNSARMVSLVGIVKYVLNGTYIP